jgi:hypothetical protein
LSGIQLLFDAGSGRSRPKAQPNGSDSTEQRLWDGFERFGNGLRGRGASTMAELNQKTAVGNGAQLEQARSDVEWYMNHGLSRERAIGMVANSSRESGLDERAVGDNGKAVGLFQWHPDRQAIYERTFGRPLASASHEEQLGYSLWELQHHERAAGDALMKASSASEAAAKVSSLYERPRDPNEANVRAGIARQLDEQLASDGDAAGQDDRQAGQAGGEAGGRVRVEIVHKNAPPGTSTNVTSSPNVDTQLKTDRQQAPLGDQYAYSPGSF